MDVTEPTVRKDIAEPRSQKVLVRTHGGAVARQTMAEVDVRQRETQHMDEERSIAKACCDC